MTILPPILAARRGRCPSCNGAVRKGEEVYEIDEQMWHVECLPEPADTPPPTPLGPHPLNRRNAARANDGRAVRMSERNPACQAAFSAGWQGRGNGPGGRR
jgi:hypothetical protein